MAMADRTWSHQGPQCPHCGRQYTADEPHYYDESNYTGQECDNCGKKFNVEVCVSVAWACEPIKEDETA
jgi:transposase-like protein